MAQRVLILDDNADMRTMIAEMLQAYGYDTLEAANEIEACDVMASHANSVQVLLADIALGKADGNQVANRLFMAYPHLRVIFMSGYLDDCVKGARCGGAFIQKPFTMSSLISVLQRGNT